MDSVTGVCKSIPQKSRKYFAEFSVL